MAKQNLDPGKLDCMANRLKALAHPIRITIIELLKKNGKMKVGDIQKATKLEQAATSNHLRILKDQQLIASTRDGKNKFYFIREGRLAAIISCIDACSE